MEDTKEAQQLMQKDGNIFTESFKNFLKRKPNVTMLGLSWAFYWRIAVVVITVQLILMGIIMIIGLLIGANIN